MKYGTANGNHQTQIEQLTMITLENDKLCFSCPAITAELRALVKEKAGKLTTQMLATNRATEFERLQRDNYEFDSLTDSYKAEATEALLSLIPEAIQEAIEKFMGGAAPFDPNAKTAPATTISFQRTLRIPDDGKTYPLPPGLGNFPLVHVDDHAKSVPDVWSKRGGITMPMYQAEALWLHFNGSYPCALKVGAGKINAVSGLPWTSSLQKEPQDYLPLPNQPWLDGYCVKKGTIRQFIAMPLGKGYSAEEQISGKGEFGGIQLQLYPLKAAIFFDERIKPRFPKRLADILPSLLPRPEQEVRPRAMRVACSVKACANMAMGLGAGGQMKQEIYQDERPLSDYDQEQTSRCFVHLCNSALWKAVTGSRPPHHPMSAQLYAEHGLPWFDYYRDDLGAIDGSKELAALKTVADLYEDEEGTDFLGNESIELNGVSQRGPKNRPKEVKEWRD